MNSFMTGNIYTSSLEEKASRLVLGKVLKNLSITIYSCSRLGVRYQKRL